MVRIDIIRTVIERHPLFWTLLTFVGFWLTAYFWLWRNGSHLHLPHFRSNVNGTGSITNSNLTGDGKMLKIMTWNLQGLMATNLEERTEAVVAVIKRENPDAVFFQELIPSTYDQISGSLKGTYGAVSGTKITAYTRYFTGIFFNSNRFTKKDHEVRKFSNSVMERTLLIVKVVDKARPNLKLALLTSHLESLPRFKESRKEQLNECLDLVNSLQPKYNVVFGGDLNLQTGEEEGLVPSGVKDVWEECGSSEDLKYTWDMRQNVNEQIPGVNLEKQPRERYDRLYFRSSTPKSLDLISLQLLGQDKVEGTIYFPSDHWALMSTFQLSEEGATSQNLSVCNIG